LSRKDLEHYEKLAKGQAPKVIMVFLVFEVYCTYYGCILASCLAFTAILLLNNRKNSSTHNLTNSSAVYGDCLCRLKGLPFIHPRVPAW